MAANTIILVTTLRHFIIRRETLSEWWNREGRFTATGRAKPAQAEE